MTVRCPRIVASLLPVVTCTSGFFFARVPTHGHCLGTERRHFGASAAASATSEISYKLIDSRKEFLEACDQLGQSSTSLAFDIECEFNLHRYGTHLCLVQVSDGNDIFILDPTAIGDLNPLWEVLANENEVIVHSPGSDITLLDKLYGRRPTNLFCTEMAARLLGCETPSLSYLLEQYFGQQKQGALSASDWFQRPLSQQMLKYAALDVAFLHQLKAVLVSELKEKGRLQWHKEECLEMEQIRYREVINPHLRIKGSKNLSEEEAHVLKYLFQVREALAKDVDKPAFQIISNKLLMHLAQNPPVRLRAWETMKGVHPRVRKQYSARFHQAVMDAKTSTPEPIERTPKYIGDESKVEILEQIRTRIQTDYPDVGNIVMSKRISDRLAAGDVTLLDLRDWQRTIVLRIGKELDLDMSMF
eukprot:scaffold5383_cov222-Amphora_coffeaeformis.AAC.6